MGTNKTPYDAFLILSFGGPEGMADVMPFLENVTRGKRIPEERKQEVVNHYKHFNGVSPINGQNRELVRKLEVCFRNRGLNLPIYWGNRNWHPYLIDTLKDMQENGVRRAIVYVTSAFGSYSGCRQYLENIQDARARLGPSAPSIDKLRSFFNHPRFIEACESRLREALQPIPASERNTVQLIFTAHSIPKKMADKSQYVNQLNEVCSMIGQKLGMPNWKLAYQSRSGPPTVPWLEPDIGDCLSQVKAENMDRVLVFPLGFMSDHVEVLFDLDVELRRKVESLGLQYVRASTVGNHSSIVEMIHDLVCERINTAAEPSWIGVLGPSPNQCSPECCILD